MAVNFELLHPGADGSYVKKLQQSLNQNGYKLDVDGKFGPQTLAAVKDYQKSNNLVVDGIVGDKTWGALTSTQPSANTQNTAPKEKTPAADQSFSYGDYKPSDTVTQAQAILQQMMQNKPGAYESQWQEQINGLMGQILNLEDFSYDLNADALYQQYADQYMTKGKLAMMDTMGQAQAMTGGYGNSYAQAVGQQAYQGYLQQLNDVVPELYGMAYDQYQQEGQNLLNQYSVLSAQEAQDYGRHRDEVSDYYIQLQQAFDQFNTERDFDFGKYADERNFAYGQFSDDRAYDYQGERDAVADKQWQDAFDYQKDRDAVADKQWQQTFDYQTGKNSGGGSSGGSGGSGSSGGSGGSGGSGSSGSSGNSGNSGNTGTKTVPDYIKEKAATFTDSDALNDYLTRQYEAGKISEEQMGELYLEYEIPSLQNRNWTLKDDGGTNWFWGVDNNAVVKDQYGNTYRLDKLVDALVAEGMSKKEAKEYVKKLQARLGA